MSTTTDLRRQRPRALPVVVVLVAVAAVALTVSPALRHQLAVSFARQPQHYVELYFADEQAARGCPVDDGRLTAEVTVHSHLDGPQRISWRAKATPGGTVSGEFATRPGRTSTVTVAVPVATSDFTATVELPGRDLRLVLHCPPT